jgi:hypothetical protein
MMPFKCSMVMAGAGSNLQNPPASSVVVQLTDLAGSFANVEFAVVPVAEREILAVALAAISTQSNVLATVDPPASVSAGSPNCYALSILTS